MKYKLTQEEMESLGLLNPKEKEANEQMYKEIDMDLPTQRYIKQLEKDLTPEDLSRVGTRIPRFGITNIALLNAGGLGVIYLAKQSPADNACMRGAGDIDKLKEEARSLGTQKFCERYDVQVPNLFYACKYIKGVKMSAEISRRRFIREGRLLTRLVHPGIPHAVFHNERVFAATYFPHSTTLERIIRTENSRTLRERFEIFKNAMAIISDVRETTLKVRGVAVNHRDIKPGNILCFWPSIPDCAAEVVDWGNTNETQEDSADPNEDTSHLTDGNIFEYTPAYSPPEQIEGGLKNCTEGSDVYSAGMSLYETLTKSLPFARQNVFDIILAIRGYNNGSSKCTPPDVRKLNPQIPYGLAARVMKAIEAKPENRFEDITEFYQELLFIAENSWPFKKRKFKNKVYRLMPMKNTNYKASSRTIMNQNPGITPQEELTQKTLYLVDSPEDIQDESVPEASIVPEQPKIVTPKDCSGQEWLKNVDPSIMPLDDDAEDKKK